MHNSAYELPRIYKGKVRRIRLLGYSVHTADFGVTDSHRMMRTYDPVEGFTQPLVHAWRMWVNINALRCR